MNDTYCKFEQASSTTWYVCCSTTPTSTPSVTNGFTYGEALTCFFLFVGIIGSIIKFSYETFIKKI